LKPYYPKVFRLSFVSLLQLRLLTQVQHTITWQWTQDITSFHEPAYLWSCLYEPPRS